MTILKSRLKYGCTLLKQSTVYRNELGLTPLKQLFVAFNIGINEMPTYADSESDEKTPSSTQKIYLSEKLAHLVNILRFVF